MNKKIVVISIIIVICIVLAVCFYVFKNCQNKQELDAAKLEKMTDSEIADLFYDLPKGDGFVNESEKKYRFSFESVDSEEEAIKNTKTIGKSDSTEMLEAKLQDETDYYYVIYQKYIDHKGTGDVIYENSYLHFKKSILDTDNKIINTEVLNSAEKIKDIFNLYVYIKDVDIMGRKVLLPEITENSDEYIYTYYEFDTSFGDFGLADNIRLYKKTATIEKESGNYQETEQLIRTVEGRRTETSLNEQDI